MKIFKQRLEFLGNCEGRLPARMTARLYQMISKVLLNVQILKTKLFNKL